MSQMNLSDILQMVQNIRSGLESWGITAQGLWIAGAVAFVCFAISLREVASWYLRVYQVRVEVRALRSEMLLMQKTLEEMRDFLRSGDGRNKALAVAEAKDDEEEAEARKPEAAGSSRFRFDH